MKLKVIRPILVGRKHQALGAIIEVDDHTARVLIGNKSAVSVTGAAPVAADDDEPTLTKKK